MESLKTSFPKKQTILLGGDIIMIIASFYFAPVIRFGVWLEPVVVFGFSDALAMVVYLAALYVFNFYNFEEHVYGMSYALRFPFVILGVNLLNSSLFYIFHLRPYNSGIIAISGTVAMVLLLGWRLAFMRLLDSKRHPLKILIVGAGITGKVLHGLLIGNREYEVVGFIDDDEKRQGSLMNNVPVLGDSGRLMDIVKEKGINKIIVAITKTIRPAIFQKLVEAKFSGVTVYEMPTFYEKVSGKIPVLHTNEMWLGYADIVGVKRNIYNVRLKKVFDKAFSLIGVLLSFPIMIATAALIKLESPGPVLYLQKRVGWDEKEFDVIKFRSMRLDAEFNGAVWAQENDRRATRVGRIIRLLRIDELPQLWNVLAGEMSFVGPRPERPEFVNILKEEIPYYSLRHAVRPGITGWAQVNYPYGASKKDALEKLQYDLYYIKNMSMFLDFHILLKTVRVMLFRKGAR